MTRSYTIAGLVCMAFAAFVVWNASSMRFYTGTGPGPGFFPLILGMLFGGLSLILVVQAVRRGYGDGEGWAGNRREFARVAAVAALLALTVPGLHYLGFRLTMLVFCLVLLSAGRKHNPLVVILFALLGSFGLHYLFAVLLRVPLPTGVLGF